MFFGLKNSQGGHEVSPRPVRSSRRRPRWRRAAANPLREATSSGVRKALRGLHPQIQRGRPRYGVQLAGRPARGLRGLYRQPARGGMASGPAIVTTTAASPAAPWSALPSSGSWPMSRPEIDVVVVYKIDRLSRSMLDFLKLVETVRASQRHLRLHHPVVQYHRRDGPDDA